jgi:hypothetical protein
VAAGELGEAEADAAAKELGAAEVDVAAGELGAAEVCADSYGWPGWDGRKAGSASEW